MFEQKCWENNRRKIFRKKNFYSLEYRDQEMVGKNAGTIFPETHEYVRAKMLGKNSLKNFRKKIFIFTRIS